MKLIQTSNTQFIKHKTTEYTIPMKLSKTNNRPVCLKKLYKILNLAGYNPITYINDVVQLVHLYPQSKCHTLIKTLYTSLVKEQYPLEYITNTAHFYGFRFFIKAPVYIPNPFTEHLLDRLILWIIAKNLHEPIEGTFIDIGTGTSAIISSLYMTLYKLNTSQLYLKDFLLFLLSHNRLKYYWYRYTNAPLNLTLIPLTKLQNNLGITLQNSKFIATELDKNALEAAKHNINKFKLPIKLIKADVVYFPLSPNILNSHNSLTLAVPISDLLEDVIIMTNKPYLPENSKVPKSVQYQSNLALYTSSSFNNKLKLFINYLKNNNHSIDLFMETLRTSTPITAKVVHHSYF